MAIPTIVATLTVVAALLPMLFVSGLMGPYMSPIPANASAAMLFSFFVAVIVTPWLMLQVRRKADGRHGHDARRRRAGLGGIYVAVARPILTSRARAWMFLLVVGVADAGLAGAVLHQERHRQAAAVRQQVGACRSWSTCRKGSSVEATDRLLQQAVAAGSRRLPRSISLQTYAGTAAPFNFNGLVRHYYLRASAGAGRHPGQSCGQGRARPQQP